jgi:DNA primase
MALCPFHPDRTPSLSVYVARDGRQRWKCHGCGKGGDSLDLEVLFTGRSIRDLVT